MLEGTSKPIQIPTWPWGIGSGDGNVEIPFPNSPCCLLPCPYSSKIESGGRETAADSCWESFSCPNPRRLPGDAEPLGSLFPLSQLLFPSGTLGNVNNLEKFQLEEPERRSPGCQPATQPLHPSLSNPFFSPFFNPHLLQIQRFSHKSPPLLGHESCFPGDIPFLRVYNPIPPFLRETR